VVKYLSLRQKALAADIQDCDFICFAGGDHWNGTRLGPAMFGALCLAAKLKKKVFCYPFSCNPASLKFNTPASLRGYFETIERPVVVRDSISMEVLAGLGVEAVFGSDSVYGLKNIIQENFSKSEARGRRVSVCVTSAKGVSTEDSTAMIIKALEAKFDRTEIEIISTCEPEDAEPLDKCEALDGIQKHYPDTWQDAVDLFCSSSLVITNRLHALILCSMCEVTVLPVTNREKSKAFALDVGLNRSCASASQFNVESADKCLSEAEDIQAKLRSFANLGFENVHSPISQDKAV
jgi:polysaccharide pyruvyl transferase WcaK-like protein